MRMVLLFVVTALLWLPYYVWGVGLGNQLLNARRFLAAAAIVSATVLVGFVGMHLVRTYLTPGMGTSNAGFRLILILGTQLTAVLLIAIDSNFNWLAILAGLLVIAGALLGSYALTSL